MVLKTHFQPQRKNYHWKRMIAIILFAICLISIAQINAVSKLLSNMQPRPNKSCQLNSCISECLVWDIGVLIKCEYAHGISGWC